MGEIQVGGGSGPSTHALIIGVSDYPHGEGGSDETEDGVEAGIKPVVGVANTAAQVAEWLLEEYRNPAAPLATVRVLLSPAQDELLPPAIAGRPEVERATHANVKRAVLQFLERTREHRENVAFAYIAGHGVQLTKDGAIVLLEDFAHPESFGPLDRAIDVARTREAFEGGADAHRQFWFVDACRGRPLDAAKYEEMDGPTSLPRAIGTVDTSVLFLGAAPRRTALLESGVGTLFGRTLLKGLRGAAAIGPERGACDDWHVSSNSLFKYLRRATPQLAADLGATEPHEIDVSGKGDAPIHRCEEVPEVAVNLTLQPPTAAATTGAGLCFDGVRALGSQGVWPIVGTVPAGLYILEVDAQPPYRRVPARPVSLVPESFEQTVVVSP